MNRFSRCVCCATALIASWTSAWTATAAELRVIYPEQEPELSGKEVDWIYGDYFMKNDQLSLVIAAPIATRDANLTVRDVGASILDLTLNAVSNDQLSAYIPGGGRYQFFDPSLVQTGREGDAVFWQCTSSKSFTGDGTTATVRYRLADGQPFVEATVRIEGAGEGYKPYDGVRADRTFDFVSREGLAYCEDRFFRQTLGFDVPETSAAPAWKGGRPKELHYAGEHVRRDGNTLSWTVRLYPATSPLDLRSVIDAAPNLPAMQTFQLQAGFPRPERTAAVTRGQVVIAAEGESSEEPNAAELQTDDAGLAHARLEPGRYRVSGKAIGFRGLPKTVQVRPQPQTVELPFNEFSGVVVEVTDGEGQPIPAKATIYADDGNHPDYGPDTTRTFIKNCVYAVHGALVCPLEPGSYEIYFSHGPEYDREVRSLEVQPNSTVELAVSLDRVVDTRGWVSTELHSHSSPSGDNTSDQYGRVENLVCEHLEFAPCTEHARISSYVPHLEAMGVIDRMATCSGIELTGSPLPVNHQNAFPLHHHPHTQNGGGPRTDPNPEVQIERLAMWDQNAEKVVQMNHPNLHQIYGDLDVDGNPDQGFRKMFTWTDVIEVHPLETIFEDVAAQPPNIREMRIPLFQWMQLLNHGMRIPGVVNTDAHYNHHGSGWLRNWFASSTDDPTQISTEEMVEQAEAGHIVMSNGPFLSVQGTSPTSDHVAIPGDDLRASDGKVNLQVKVQCPNWLDVNRVQVFVNGRPSEQHLCTRKSTPKRFGDVDSVVKFDSTFEIELDQDAHLIVATIGEGMTMNRVMGEQYGNRQPIAVSNPIFVDVDGGGFDANQDDLGLPLPEHDH